MGLQLKTPIKIQRVHWVKSVPSVLRSKIQAPQQDLRSFFLKSVEFFLRDNGVTLFRLISLPFKDNVSNDLSRDSTAGVYGKNDPEI
jgi:hypothetical protein